MKNINIIIISDYDSRIKWSLSLLPDLFRCFQVEAVHIKLLYKSLCLEVLDDYQCEGIGLQKYKSINQIKKQIDFTKINIVILALGGVDNLRFISHFKNVTDRPVIISGFNGITDGYDLHGLLCRYGSDIICINNYKDMIYFSDELRKLDLSSDSLLLTGIQRSYLKYIEKKEEKKEIHTMLFVEQIGIPDSIHRLKFLINGLVHIANKNPDKKIIIKLRESLYFDSVNFKDRKYNFKKIWGKVVKVTPQNIVFSELSIEKLLLMTDFCMSFTSSVLIEALYLGKKVGVISDFGIGKKIGNHVFTGSNLFISLEDIANISFSEVNPVWLSNYCLFNQNNKLVEKIDFLLRHSRNNVNCFYTEDKFPFFYLGNSRKTDVKNIVLHLYDKIKQIVKG